jgi:membrane-associated protease RseP (regulator of RpoE activity)
MNDADSPFPSDPQSTRASAHGFGSAPAGASGAPPTASGAGEYSSDVLHSVEDLAALLPPPPKLPPVDADLAQSGFPPRRRRLLLPVVLFLASCLSTYWVGLTSLVSPQVRIDAFQAAEQAEAEAVQQGAKLSAEERRQLREQVSDDYQLQHNTSNALTYMIAVMSILLAHEMGHFLQTVRHRIPASLPFFIPMPVGPLGTMGAVIGMSSNLANRRQLFDIGVSGPIAGLVLAIPIAWFGIRKSEVVSANDPRTAIQGAHLTRPWIVDQMAHYLHPEMTADQELVLNPLYHAGWIGMLITGLNMLPISQLDGGHVVYTLFGPRLASAVARGFVVMAVLYIISEMAIGWIPMFTLVLLIGIQHPPSADDTVELSTYQRVVALASLAIPFACFPPGGIHV